MSHPAIGSRFRAIRAAMSSAEWARLAAMFALILATGHEPATPALTES